MNIVEYLCSMEQSGNNALWAEEEFDKRGISEAMHVKETLLLSIIKIIDDKAYRDSFWETVIVYILPISITDDVFKYFFSNRIAYIQLAHMELTDKQLKALSEFQEEALFTLAKRTYVSSQYSVIDLYNLLTRKRNISLLEQLQLVTPSDIEKKSLLLYFFGKIDEKRIEELIKTEYLKITNDVELIDEAFRSGNPLYWQAITKNYFTPSAILLELSTVKGVKNASEIRESSLETLKIVNADESSAEETSIDVEIKYRYDGSEKWNCKKLTEAEYFDMKYLDENEKPDVDSIPLHFYNNADYLKDSENIKQIVTTITDKRAKKIVTYSVFPDVTIGERYISRTTGVEHEIIVDKTLENNSEWKVYEILRFSRNSNGAFDLVFRTKGKEFPDGSQKEISEEV